MDRFVVPQMRLSSADLKKPTEMSVNDDARGACDRDIVVKEAKIDPVRLIQGITRRGVPKSPVRQRRTLRRRSTPENLRDGQSSSSFQSVGGNGGKRVVSTPHEEAIQFELSISFNGRKYTATRTMQSIVYLRNDLIREVKHRRQRLRVQQPERSDSKDDIANIQIPEIPPIANAGGGGIMGRGFIMLHAVLSSYRPLMERWLRNILSIVPHDSECLTDFLWEPVSEEFQLGVVNLCKPKLTKLNSIEEHCTFAEDSEEDTETDDEWDG